MCVCVWGGGGAVEARVSELFFRESKSKISGGGGGGGGAGEGEGSRVSEFYFKK